MKMEDEVTQCCFYIEVRHAHVPNAQFHTGQNQNDVCSHSYIHSCKCQIQNTAQIQHYCVLLKIMKTAPAPNIYLIVQNVHSPHTNPAV